MKCRIDTEKRTFGAVDIVWWYFFTHDDGVAVMAGSFAVGQADEMWKDIQSVFVRAKKTISK